MGIEEAKKSLEAQVILMDGVIGIGTVEEQGRLIIEVAVDKQIPDAKLKVQALLQNSTWQNHPVLIKEINQFNKH